MSSAKIDLDETKTFVMFSTLAYVLFSLALGAYALLFNNIDDIGIIRVLNTIGIVALFSTKGLLVLPVWTILTTLLSILVSITSSMRKREGCARKELLASIRTTILTMVLITSFLFFLGVFIIIGWFAVNL